MAAETDDPAPPIAFAANDQVTLLLARATPHGNVHRSAAHSNKEINRQIKGRMMIRSGLPEELNPNPIPTDGKPPRMLNRQTA
ncbi:MAG: hypothetical protein AAF065_05405 [Verrucomicrobiota bacterium]